MGIAGNAAVEASPAVAPRVGLIATAREISRIEEQVSSPSSDANPTPRWEAGFSWEPEACGSGGVVDPCDGTGSKTVSDGPDPRLYDPVAIWTGDKCSTKGVRDRIGRVRRKLIACQSKLLAQELWNGALAIDAGFPNAYLTNDDIDNVLTAAPVSEVSALACLEQGLADCSCSGVGMIHATPALMTRWADHGLVQRFGNTFRTFNDTLVVADAGYTGEGPGGLPPADGSVWAYATDLIEVRLGPIEVLPRNDPSAEGLGRSGDAYLNSLTYRAERLAAASWDGCCHLAVEVDMPICADLATS